jgi:hypothetical protein
MCSTQSCNNSKSLLNQGITRNAVASSYEKSGKDTTIKLTDVELPSLEILKQSDGLSEKKQSEDLKISNSKKLSGFGLVFEKFAFTFSTGMASMVAMFVTCPCPSHLGIIPTILGISFIFDKVLSKSLKVKK